jgi:mannose/cellobiose epimerase-like protein (N-acyl-D-glucosamine 2-epimerase family)
MISTQRQLVGWLREHALPLWDRHGVDWSSGGYFEEIACVGPQQTMAVSGATRRGRVVARQIYVFDVGQRLGWRPAAANPVDHGCAYLFSSLYLGDGILITAVDAATRQASASFSLYEQAFYLFALARLNATATDHYPVAATATRCLERLRVTYGKTMGGFDESSPSSLPLKSNPHMHLLEAALEWITAASGHDRQIWIDLAREIVGLCLTRFTNQSTGAIHEYFDRQWHPAPGEEGRIVEPGHQFEWAWLLMRWAESPYSTVAERPTCRLAARRLIEIGEKWGVDSGRGVVINEIWDDMTTKDARAKLWPQTERVKAWCAMLGAAATLAEAEHACHKIVIAAEGLAKYLRPEAPGLWHETYSANGGFPPGPSKASSLYHLVGAIDVLQKTASARLGCGPMSNSDRPPLMSLHQGLA